MNKCELVDYGFRGIDSNTKYIYCKDCPYFWECKEEDDKEEEKK